MPDASTYGLFVAASLALTLLPGPAVFYIVARGMEGGRLAGLVSVAGVGLGTLVHVALATAGLSAIVASSATAFGVVKWLGVAYLVWLGLQRLLASGGDDEMPAREREGRSSRIFAESALVQVLNPKVALFFLAFLPQFADQARGPVWAQILALGLTFAAVGTLTDGLYALLSGTAGSWLRNTSAGLRRGKRYVSGGIYLALGAAAAATGSVKA